MFSSFNRPLSREMVELVSLEGKSNVAKNFGFTMTCEVLGGEGRLFLSTSHKEASVHQLTEGAVFEVPSGSVYSVEGDLSMLITGEFPFGPVMTDVIKDRGIVTLYN